MAESRNGKLDPMSHIIPKRVLDDIRFRNDIVDVIGAYFNIKRAGSTFRALCPFHKEKTPSFHINPQRQIFHCFGCGAGGDVFGFLMQG
jgi:DNA primase